MKYLHELKPHQVFHQHGPFHSATLYPFQKHQHNFECAFVHVLQLLVDLKEKLGLDAIRLVGDPEKMVKKVGLCTGAGVGCTALAAAKGCDAYLTGDIKYHEAQEAIEKSIAVVDVTHYASEVLIVPVLQKKLTEAAKENGWDIEVVCSKVNGQTFWTV